MVIVVTTGHHVKRISRYPFTVEMEQIEARENIVDQVREIVKECIENLFR